MKFADLGWIVLLLVAIAGVLTACPAAAQPVVEQQWQIKATYLQRLGRHVQWPEDEIAVDREPFVIGVLGGDPFGVHLHRLETVNGRPVQVHRFADMDQYKPCQILFVSPVPSPGRAQQTVEQRLQAALAKLDGLPVLLVAASPGLAHKGAMVNFVVDVQVDRVRMEINVEAVGRAGLRIEAPLLNLEVVTIVAGEQ